MRLDSLRALVLVAVFAAVASACGHQGVSADGLRSYVRAVEPIRLGVNRLLDGADPVLDAYREHRIDATQALAAMDHLEKQFAASTVAVNALRPSDPALRRINAAYAHTYIEEDAYLSALVAALPDREFSALPDTQSAQRAAIIEWRTRLEVLARRTGVHLPADLQQAGRGEIAPPASGGS